MYRFGDTYKYVFAFQDACNATHEKLSVEKRGEPYLNEIKK
jgi:hypothetical protein